MSIFKLRKLILFSVLFLFALVLNVQAAPYDITNLRVYSSGSTEPGLGFTLNVDFILKSVSGFASKRLELTVAGKPQSTKFTGPAALTIKPLADNPRKASVEVKLTNFNIPPGADRRKVEVEILYYLSAARSGDPLVSKKVTINLGDDGAPPDPGNPSPPGGGNPGCKDKINDANKDEDKIETKLDSKVNDTNFLAVLEVQDFSHTLIFGPDGKLLPGPIETDDSKVPDDIRNERVNRISQNLKRFKIIIHHDPKLIPDTEADTFQDDNSPVLKALDISTNRIPADHDLTEQEKKIQDDPNKELFISIKDKFSFEVVDDTDDSFRNKTLKRQTIFYADIDDSLLQYVQTLKFTIRTKKLLESLQAGIGLPMNAKPIDNFKINLEGKLLANEELSLSTDTILLIPQSSEENNRLSLVTHKPLQIDINLEANDSSLDRITSNKSKLSGLVYRSRFYECALDDVRDSILKSRISINNDSVIATAGSVNFDFDLNIRGPRNLLLAKRELFKDTIQKDLFLDIILVGVNYAGLAVNVDAGLDRPVTLKVLDDPKFISPNKARAKFTSKEKKGELIKTLKFGFSYSNIVSKNIDSLILDLKFLDSLDNEISGNVYSIPKISKIKDAHTNTRDDIPLNYRRSIKLKNDTHDANGRILGPTFFDEAEGAAKVEMTLRRDEGYLDSLNLPNDTKISGILDNFTERRIIVDIR